MKDDAENMRIGTASPPAVRPRPLGDRSLMWRLVVVALIPIAVMTVPLVLFRTVPQTVDGIGYEVRINRLTGSSCLLMDRNHARGDLGRYLC